MFDLLNSKPDVDAYLATNKVSIEFLEMLGIQKSDLKTLKDLTDLSAVLSSLKGNLKAKSYIDSQYKLDQDLAKLNRS